MQISKKKLGQLGKRRGFFSFFQTREGRAGRKRLKRVHVFVRTLIGPLRGPSLPDRRIQRRKIKISPYFFLVFKSFQLGILDFGRILHFHCSSAKDFSQIFPYRVSSTRRDVIKLKLRRNYSSIHEEFSHKYQARIPFWGDGDTKFAIVPNHLSFRDKFAKLQLQGGGKRVAAKSSWLRLFLLIRDTWKWFHGGRFRIGSKIDYFPGHEHGQRYSLFPLARYARFSQEEDREDTRKARSQVNAIVSINHSIPSLCLALSPRA